MFNIQEDISSKSKKLTLKEPYYGMFLIGLNKVISNQIPTACVSRHGINCQLTVNEQFWQELDDSTRIGVLKHELLHIAFMHLLEMGRFSDKELCNIAMDIEINQYIQSDYKGEKWNGRELDTFPELNLEAKKGFRYYYEKLQEAKNNPGTSPTLDKMMAARQQMNVFVDKNGKPVCTGGHELWDQFEDMSETEQKLIQKQIEHQMKEAAEAIRNRGTIPSELQAMIDLLYVVAEPVINWKSYMKRFVGSSTKIYTKKSRRKPNKRYADNPALKIKQKKLILVGVDTSGSVSDYDMKEFFHEIHHIWKSGVEVHIAECDAAVANVWEYKGKAPDSIHGRGGTDFDPVIEYLNDNTHKYNSIVYLTDGYCTAPTIAPSKPILWVLCSGGAGLDSIKDFPGLKVEIKKQNI